MQGLCSHLCLSDHGEPEKVGGISHIHISQQWGPREARGYVAILITLYDGAPRRPGLSSHMDISSHCGRRESRGHIAVMMCSHNGEPKRVGVMKPYGSLTTMPPPD